MLLRRGMACQRVVLWYWKYTEANLLKSVMYLYVFNYTLLYIIKFIKISVLYEANTLLLSVGEVLIRLWNNFDLLLPEFVKTDYRPSFRILFYYFPVLLYIYCTFVVMFIGQWIKLILTLIPLSLNIHLHTQCMKTVMKCGYNIIYYTVMRLILF
jgi:hypothetical protein